MSSRNSSQCKPCFVGKAPDGKDCLHKPLSGKLGEGTVAFIDADLDLIIRDRNWTLSRCDGYDTVLCGGRTVSHLIMGTDGKKTICRHKENNRLDLRRESLAPVEKKARGPGSTKRKRLEQRPWKTIAAYKPSSSEARIFVEHPLIGNEGGKASLDVQDFGELWVLGGVKQRWYRKGGGGGIVTCQLSHGKDVAVGRVIARAGVGQKVEYIDGDPLNLRRDNLEVVKGAAEYADYERLLRWHVEHMAAHQEPLEALNSEVGSEGELASEDVASAPENADQ